MPRVSPIFSAFNAGELAPVMDGRVDLAKYPNACKTLENFIVVPQGGFIKRGGSRFVAYTKFQNKYARFVSFKFSTTQAYVLEFGDQYMRVYKDGGVVTESPKTITAATKANPCVVTSAAHGFNNGDRVFIAGAVGMSQINNREFTVANKTTNTFELSGVNSSGYDTYTSAGTAARIYEIATPYLEAELRSLRFVQSNDVQYITHVNYPLRKLSRTGHTAWTLTVADLKDGPWGPENTDFNFVISQSGETGPITLTASGGAPYVATDVGRLFYNWNTTNPNKRGSSTITGYVSSTVVNATVQSGGDYGYESTGNSYKFAFGLYGVVNKFPRVCCFFEDRLWLGGCDGAPQRIDGSVLGQYERFSPGYLPRDAGGSALINDETATDDMALSFQVLANDVNVPRWIIDDEKGLLVGTAGAEYALRTSSNQAAVSATNPPQARRVSNHGCADVAAIRADRAVLFVSRDGKHLHEFAYVYDSDGYATPDLTLLASHIGEGGMVDLAYEAKHKRIVWVVRGDGVLLGLTYQRDQDVVGWHRHILGGYADAGKTAAAIVESIATIPSTDGTRDETWLVVKRYINGGTVRYVEYLTPIEETVAVPETCVRTDCTFVYDGAPTSTITGLWALEGEEVALLVDGAIHPRKTVAAGKVSLNWSGSKVLIGLPFRSRLQTMRIEAGSADGTAQGKVKRIHSLILRVLDTLGGKAGTSFAKLQTIPGLNSRAAGTPMGTATPLKTGDVDKMILEGGYDRDGHICIEHDEPLPMTVLALLPQLQTNDR